MLRRYLRPASRSCELKCGCKSVDLGCSWKVSSSNKLPGAAPAAGPRTTRFEWPGCKEHCEWIQVSWMFCFTISLSSDLQEAHPTWETRVLSPNLVPLSSLGCYRIRPRMSKFPANHGRPRVGRFELSLFLSPPKKSSLYRVPHIAYCAFVKVSKSQKWQH